MDTFAISIQWLVVVDPYWHRHSIQLDVPKDWIQVQSCWPSKTRWTCNQSHSHPILEHPTPILVYLELYWSIFPWYQVQIRQVSFQWTRSQKVGSTRCLHRHCKHCRQEQSTRRVLTFATSTRSKCRYNMIVHTNVVKSPLFNKSVG